MTTREAGPEAGDDCRAVLAQLPAFVLGALDNAEATLIDEHLLACPNCERDHVGWHEYATLVALGAQSAVPPAALKARIMAMSAAARSTSVPTTPPRAAAVASSSLPHLVRRVAYVPALALILILGLWSFTAQQRLGEERDWSTRLESENATLTANLATLQLGIGGQTVNARWYPLSTVDESFADVGGVVMGDPALSIAILSVWNMPPGVGPLQVICESRLGEMLAAGELRVDEAGSGTIMLNLPGGMTEYRIVHIIRSDEPPTGGDLANRDVLLVHLDVQPVD